MEIILSTIILALLAASFLNYVLRIRHGWITIIASALSLAASLFLLFSVQQTSPVEYYFAGLPGQPFLLYANVNACVLSITVSVVALAIFIYSLEYMAQKKGKTWFWGGISLFLASMQLLVFAGDWLLFITAWEMMGAASFLLIGTWHEKPEARQGAVKAFMLTRFTDMGLYAGIFILILTLGSTHITANTEKQISTLGGIFLLIAIMGKSAQVPFQSWLSGAMAGPTPVSALLHSATMVAAGAILLFRIYPLLNEDVLFITGIVGGITILLTGITAITAKDVKQLLAASTSSQLGFMLLAVGAGSPGAAFAHWIAHAFMKSSLFLGAGIFQHVYHSTAFEDISGAGKKLKSTFTGFAIAAIGLSGIPPLIGYWSKDGILASTSQSAHSLLFFTIAVAGAFFTAIYMGKAVNRIWAGQENTSDKPGLRQMISGLFILVVFIVAGGFFLEPIVKFAGYEIPSGTLSKIAGITAAVAGLLAGWYVKEKWLNGKLWNAARGNYQVAGGYQKLVVVPVLKLTAFFYHVELLLNVFISKTGQSFVSIAKLLYGADKILNNLTEDVGSTGLQLSAASNSFEENGIEKGVYSVSSSVKESGRVGRKLQSGLVHKELVITVAGLLILIFVLISMIII